MNKEEQLLKRRFLDLATAADNRGVCLFSDFLNLHEQSIFAGMKHELPKIKYFSCGGFKDAERKILCFCGDYEAACPEDVVFPVACLKIVPINQKFSDNLSHRDFLGALINLGIDRYKMGDIIIEENEGYLFCSGTIADFITEELIQIKHTRVRVHQVEAQDFNYQPTVREISGTVSSVRLDSILSVAFQGSRSSLSGLIAGGKVFVNSKEVLSNSYSLKENDVVSVRGMGKFRYLGTDYQTKKGRNSVKIQLYI